MVLPAMRSIVRRQRFYFTPFATASLALGLLGRFAPPHHQGRSRYPTSSRLTHFGVTGVDLRQGMQVERLQQICDRSSQMRAAEMPTSGQTIAA
jgi:hypothetical protein